MPRLLGPFKDNVARATQARPGGRNFYLVSNDDHDSRVVFPFPVGEGARFHV